MAKRDYALKIISYYTRKNGALVPEYQVYFCDVMMCAFENDYIEVVREADRLCFRESFGKTKSSYKFRRFEQRIQLSGRKAKEMLDQFVGIYGTDDVYTTLGQSDRTNISIYSPKINTENELLRASCIESLIKQARGFAVEKRHFMADENGLEVTVSLREALTPCRNTQKLLDDNGIEWRTE